MQATYPGGETWVCSLMYVMFDSQNGYALSNVTLQAAYSGPFHMLLNMKSCHLLH